MLGFLEIEPQYAYKRYAYKKTCIAGLSFYRTVLQTECLSASHGR